MKPRMAALALLVLFGRLSAQQVLLAEYDGKLLPVVKAHGSTALVMNGDKLTPVENATFTLRDSGEYLPFFVAVDKVNVSTHSIVNVNAGGNLNNEFRLHAAFASPYEIPDVYVVLALKQQDGGLGIFVQNVGDLHAGQSRVLDISVPLNHPLGEGHGHYRMRLYSGGVELLHSLQRPALRERALDRIVAQRAAGQPDGPPQLLVGPAPEYPRALRKTHPVGQAVVHCLIHKNGTVTDIAVSSATDPAFGEAALAAVRQWRFIPRIKDGVPVDMAVDVPLNFAAPKKS